MNAAPIRPQLKGARLLLKMAFASAPLAKMAVPLDAVVIIEAFLRPPPRMPPDVAEIVRSRDIRCPLPPYTTRPSPIYWSVHGWVEMVVAFDELRVGDFARIALPSDQFYQGEVVAKNRRSMTVRTECGGHQVFRNARRNSYRLAIQRGYDSYRAEWQRYFNRPWPYKGGPP